MSRATPQMRHFAARLIAYEAGGHKLTPERKPEAFPVIHQLRPLLATLMGNTGFHSLLARALLLASAEVPSLLRLQVTATGVLEVSEASEVRADPQEMAEGRVILIAHLLGLLVVFIGESLMLRLIIETWPRLPLDDYFDQGDAK